MADARGSVIVTGASRGIGAAIAQALAAQGYHVCGLSRSGVCAVGTAYRCDLSSEADIASSIDEIARRGSVVGLVNNAGQHLSSASDLLTTAEYEQVMALNATAVMVASRQVYPHLLAAGGGTIINIGSFFDKLGVAGNLAYCASKAAVGAMTRCLAVEWAESDIRVLNIAPGYIKTDLNRELLATESSVAWMKKRIPVGGPGTPEQVARLAVAVMDRELPFLTGETIYLDGGQGMNH